MVEVEYRVRPMCIRIRNYMRGNNDEPLPYGAVDVSKSPPIPNGIASWTRLSISATNLS